MDDMAHGLRNAFNKHWLFVFYRIPGYLSYDAYVVRDNNLGTNEKRPYQLLEVPAKRTEPIFYWMEG